jgi:hypothetical protein
VERVTMTLDEVVQRLEKGEVVLLQKADWEGFAEQFCVLRSEDTGLSGQISALRAPAGHIVVMEEPNAKERTLRIMRDEDAAGQFIAERIETYERMWEGCGCKIDYYR